MLAMLLGMAGGKKSLIQGRTGPAGQWKTAFFGSFWLKTRGELPEVFLMETWVHRAAIVSVRGGSAPVLACKLC